MSTVEQKVPALLPGQRLTRDEFLRRWEALPDLKHAELVGGVVYMPSPVRLEHGDQDSLVSGWLNAYMFFTPGCKASINATWFMLSDAPQPDDTLRILPEFGGKSNDDGRYGIGAPELLVEVSLSSADFDLHEKLDLYQKAGVQEYVIVLVEANEVRWHRLVAGAYELLPPSEDGVLRSVVFPGLWLNPGALLAQDIRQLWATLQQGVQTPEHTAFVALLASRRSQ
jgi:Uma2 family endonuclease